ncbi:MAG: two-component regulator propeller domain-containing protein [Flavobacteriales bacterium]
MRKLKVVLFLLLAHVLVFGQPEKYKIYSITKEDGLISDYIESVYRDSYGFLWVANVEGLNRLDGSNFKKYRHSDQDSTSLSNNIVYSILQDSEKRLWFGTNSGLNLYDRERDCFVHITLAKPGETVCINVVKEDSKKHLWLGTSYGLCDFDPATRKYVWYHHDSKNSSSISDNNILGLSIDSHSNLWIGTFNGGVNKMTIGTRKFTHYFHEEDNAQTICSNKIRTILADHNDNIWIGSFESGVTLMNNKGAVIRHYSDFSDKEHPSATRDAVISIYEDKNNNVWVGSDNELVYYLDSKRKVFVPFKNSPYKKFDLHCLSVSSMFEDNDGNLWFGTHGYGLFYTSRSKNVFRFYHKKDNTSDGLNHDFTSAFYEDKKGNVWVGTDGGGLTLFEPSTGNFTSFTTDNGLSSNAILEIKEDKNGKLWLATWSGGLICFDPATRKSISYTNDPKNINSIIFNNIKSIIIEDSIIWIGTHGEGVCVMDLKTKQFIHHKNNKTYPFDMKTPSWINHMFKDSKGRIWISSFDGLFVYDRKKMHKFVHQEDPGSISSNDVNMVTEDLKGNIWVVTESGGLEMFDEKTQSFQHFGEKYKMPQTLKAIVFDNNGVLWLSSNEGLIAFNPQSKKIDRYDVSDGLQGNFFFLKSVLKGRNGDLYFGGTNGFNVFNPDKVGLNAAISPLYLTDLYIFDEIQKPGGKDSPLEREINFTETLTLSHDQSFFSIGFTSLNLSSSDKTEFAYKLEGLHDEWIAIHGDRKISFTDLDPGTYVLKIKRGLPDSDDDHADKELRIVILPPWWKTTLFKLFLVVLVIGGVTLFFYARLNAIRKRNKQLRIEVANRTRELTDTNVILLERNEEIKIQNKKLEAYNEEITKQSERILKQQSEILVKNQELEETVNELTKLNQTKNKFFSILAHDLKSHVYALTSISNLLKKKLPVIEKESVSEYVDSIDKSSNSIYQLLINLLDWARTQSKNIPYSPAGVNVYELITKNGTLMEQQFRNKSLALEVKIDPTQYIYADYPMIDAVVRNLLGNSIKFTAPGGRIIVESEEVGDEILIRIQDTGVGMTKEQIDNAFRIDKNASSRGTAGETGTGLGLIIIREFLETNKGSIQIESEPGKGSTFTVRVPRFRSAVPLEGSGISKPHPAGVTIVEHSLQKKLTEEKMLKIKGKRVLIVEDNSELRSFLRLLLSDVFTVFEAENGEEGLKLAAECQPTVIITDMIMPVMNGLEFCAEIKKSKTTSHIPVIMLTGQSDEESQLSGYEAGAEVYLMKPVNQDILFQVILNFIQNQEKIRQKILNTNDLYPEDVIINKLDEEFLNEIIAFIEKNMSDTGLDSKMICEHMGISRTVLYSKFKSITGQGVQEFIKSVRLKKSLKLLFERRLTISETGYEVGFSSPSYFIRCFTQQYGMPPKEYINFHKQQK